MNTTAQHIKGFDSGYTKFGDVPDHKFAKFLRKVTNNKIDYDQCGNYSMFFNGATKQFVAVVSYNNWKCTKNVSVLDQFVPELENILAEG